MKKSKLLITALTLNLMFLNAGVNVYASPKITMASEQVKAEIESQTKMWDYKTFIDENKIVEKVKEILYTDLQHNEINFKNCSFETFLEVLGLDEYGKEYYRENRKETPLAYTSPENGVIYINNEHPQFNIDDNTYNEVLIKSVLVHEAMHYLSANHKGFQECSQTGITFNYDEAVTDYFAEKIYKSLFNLEYKTNYYARNIAGESTTYWLGHMIQFINPYLQEEDSIEKMYFMEANRFKEVVDKYGYKIKSAWKKHINYNMRK